MNLNNIPQHILQEIINLTQDQQFQKRFKEDEQMDYLESLEHDKQIQFHELQLCLNNQIDVYDIKLNPLTLALFSYLYSIESPIVFDIQKTTLIDIDVFFYLLQTKDYGCDIKQVFTKALGFCKNVLKLNQEQTVKLFNRIYKIEFRCLNLFPKCDQYKKPLFNIDWMISIISKVKPLTSYSTKELYRDISLSQVYYYFASYCRMQGDQRIFIRTEEQILYEQDCRMCELVVDRLIEKNIISPDQREEILKLIYQEKENGEH